MRIRVRPGRSAIVAVAACGGAALLAVLAGVEASTAGRAALGALGLLLAGAAVDYLRSVRGWRKASVQFRRRLPAAFALGVKRPVTTAFDVAGSDIWRCDVYDRADPSLVTEGLPASLALAGGQRTEMTY